MSLGLLNGNAATPSRLLDSNGVAGLSGTVATALGGGLFSWNVPSVFSITTVPTTGSTVWTASGTGNQFAATVNITGVTTSSKTVAVVSNITSSVGPLPFVVAAIAGTGQVLVYVSAPAANTTALLTQSPGLVVNVSVLAF